MLGQPGFFEFMVSRTNERTKQGKEWKFGIIQLIATKHPNILQQQLGTEKLIEVQVYIKRGVFFVPAEVAMEIATQDM